MKTKTELLLSILLVLSPGLFRETAAAESTPKVIHDNHDFRRGDVNNDGLVDMTDVTSLMDYLFLGTFKQSCDDAADVNDSGIIDNSDVVYQLRFLFEGGPPPPHPGPSRCGEDQTGDELTCLYSFCSRRANLEAAVIEE